jgi:hypothetical protein
MPACHSPIPPCYGEATVEKIAGNAVMAGCEPPMMDVLLPFIKNTRFKIGLRPKLKKAERAVDEIVARLMPDIHSQRS